MKLSIVIPAYNEEHYIHECLQACTKLRTPFVKEIVVVNNASADSTGKIARSFSEVSVVDEPRKGLTIARQTGLNATSGEFVAFLDADTRVTGNWFAIAEKECTRDPNLVVLTGPYTYYDLSFFHHIGMQFLWLCFVYPAALLTRRMVTGGNFIVRRSAIDSIGGFDESISFYGEDTDIGVRLSSKGKITYKLHFSISTSARRYKGQGFWKTLFIYIGNFLSQVFLHKPITKSYEDIR